MELILHKKNTVCVKMTKSEMKEMGYSYETLDNNGLMLVSRKISTEFGFDTAVKGTDTLVEALPDFNGNCLLFFQNGKKYRTRSDNFDTLCRYSKILNGTGLLSSTLYKSGKEYLIEITVANPSEKDELVLSEFCENTCSPGGFTPIIKHNAVRIMSNLV